jgi:hypothetical protein
VKPPNRDLLTRLTLAPETHMPVTINPLCELLVERFEINELLQLLATDEILSRDRLADAIDFHRSKVDVAFELVRAAEARGRLPALAAAAAKARPHLPEAKKVADLYGGAAPVGGGFAFRVDNAAPPGVNSAQVQVAAGQFNWAFNDRRRLIARLELYKALHDILHQLRASHGELVRLVKAAREPGYDPLDAGDTPDTLSQWLKTVDRPGRLPRWVPKFAEATRVVGRCINGEAVPTAEADEKLELLRKIPADEQADLNERLVEAARDLDLDGLDAPLQALRLALGPDHGSELQQRYDEFRANCNSVRQLIDDHDECQAMDAEIAEAVGLVRAPGAVPPAWDKMQAHLDNLARARPDHAALKRLTQMVNRLAAAPAPVLPDRLPNLQAAFGHFFFDLDAELLDTTDQVVHTADVLDFRLRGYMR